MNEDEPMAREKINEIESWLNAVSHELDTEQISYGELAQIDHIHESIKVFLNE